MTKKRMEKEKRLGSSERLKVYNLSVRKSIIRNRIRQNMNENLTKISGNLLSELDEIDEEIESEESTDEEEVEARNIFDSEKELEAVKTRPEEKEAEMTEMRKDVTEGKDVSHVRVDVKETVDLLSPKNLLTILLYFGVNRLSRKQFNVVRRLLKAKKCGICGISETGYDLPSLTAVYRKLQPFMKKKCLPRSEIVMINFDDEKAGSMGGLGSYKSDKQVPVCIVRPSEWAKLDFVTPNIYQLIWGEQKECNLSSIEKTPIVEQRNSCLNEIKLPTKYSIEEEIAEGMLISVVVPEDEDSRKMIGSCNLNNKTKQKNGQFLEIEFKIQQFCYVDGNNRKGRYENDALAGDVLIEVENDNIDIIIVCRYVRNSNTSSKNVIKYFTKHNKTIKAQEINIESIAVGDQEISFIEKESTTRNKGIMMDGTKYFVYRVLLYSDGFNPHQSRRGSMDGIYMIVLGIPIGNRNAQTCIRKICLCAPGTNANNIFELLFDDIRESIINGIELFTIHGKVKIFLDIVAYIGDAPALASLNGLKGHMSNIPCHLCLLIKNSRNVMNMKYCEHAENDSTNPSERRTGKRTEDGSLHFRGREKMYFDAIGVSSLNSTLSKLRKVICGSCKDVPLNDDGKPVIDAIFDEYRSTLISPDHVFFGIGKNILEAILKLLRKKEVDMFEALVRDYLSAGKISCCKSILNSERNACGNLNISEVYNILLVSPLAIRAIIDLLPFHSKSKDPKKAVGEEQTNLAKKVGLLQVCTAFQTLVSRTHFFPNKNFDSEAMINWYMDEKRIGEETRLKYLYNLCKTYEENLKTFFRLDKEIGGLLDKPNLHRLRELFAHTLPMFGTLRHIEELILEKGHQPLKRAIKKSNQKNSQLQAMNDYLVDDLFSRLESICREKLKFGFSETEIDSLKYIFHFRNDLSTAESEMIKNTLNDAFDENVVQTIRDIANPMSSANIDIEWIPTVDKTSPTNEKVIMDRAEKTIRKSLITEHQSIDVCANFCKNVRRFVRASNNSEKNGEISELDVINMVCKNIWQHDDENYNFVSFDSSGAVHHFLCLGIINITAIPLMEKTFLVCKPFKDISSTESNSKELENYRTKLNRRIRKGQVLRKADRFTKDPPFNYVKILEEQYFLFTLDASRVLLIETNKSICPSIATHACWADMEDEEESSCLNRNGTIFHNRSILNGGKYILLGRENGFPPKQG